MGQMEINQSENRTETKKSAPGILRKPYKIRLLSDGVPAYTGAGTEYLMLGRISDDHQLGAVVTGLRIFCTGGSGIPGS